MQIVDVHVFREERAAFDADIGRVVARTGRAGKGKTRDRAEQIDLHRLTPTKIKTPLRTEVRRGVLVDA
jgi:hypothetical protein